MVRPSSLTLRQLLLTAHGWVGKLACRLESRARGDTVADLGPFAPRQASTSLSPFTGMDRRDWLDCARHVLEGAFRHVRSADEPMLLPRLSGRAYPWLGNWLGGRRRAEATFEALVRTLHLAAPLIAADPDARIRGIHLGDYYKRHLLAAITDPRCGYWIGQPDARKPRQPTIELGTLALWCVLAPGFWWERLSREEQDKVGATLRAWAAGPTCNLNWRWFNVMMLTLLARQGRDFDRALMRHHLDRLASMAVGDGWYADVGFDYYTPHAFHLYGAVWSRHHGREHEPELAARFDRHLADFTRTGPMLFSREGRVSMYGRSIAYRQAATAGMVASFLADQPAGLQPGEARRVCSAALLQFVGRADVFPEGIPALGFYGPFEPAVQRYSCSASPYAMFSGFTALTLPADHPFWTASEVPGAWAQVGADSVRSEFLAGPLLLLSNHGPTGAAEIRPSWSSRSAPQEADQRNRQVYSTGFPWEAATADGPIAAQLTVDGVGQPLRTECRGFRDGVLYRCSVFGPDLRVESASLVIPGGEIRIDRVVGECESLQLGHFSLPHLGGEPVIRTSDVDGHAALTLTIPGRTLGLVAYKGWGAPDTKTRRGLHPEAPVSTLPYLSRRDPSAGPMVSVLLHRLGPDGFQANDLNPILRIVSGAHGAQLVVELASGDSHTIDFTAPSGN